MDKTLRSCRRTGCRWPAVASLSYRYQTRQVWLSDLGESHPSLYDLCPHHADNLTVPLGWERVDQRTPPAVEPEPAARELAAPSAARATAGARPSTAARRPAGGRYSRLSAELPRLAAEFAASRAAFSADAHGGMGAGAGTGIALGEDGAAATARVLRDQPSPAPWGGQDGDETVSFDRPAGGQLGAVVPPQVVDPAAWAMGDDWDPAAGAPHRELAGQLSIPIGAERAVGDADDAGDRAVVVPFELAGARRRGE